MSELTSAFGNVVPYEFKHKDKTYTVSHLTQKIKAEFEQKIFARAREVALLLKPAMTAEEYANHLKRLNDDFIAGLYGIESENMQKVLGNIKGVITLAALLFGLSEDEMIKIFLSAKEEVVSLLRLIINDSLGVEEEETK